MLLAFTVNSFVYFGFVNNYSSLLFNHQNLIEQFHSGVYQYRILSVPILLWIYDGLAHFNINFELLKLKSLNPDFDAQMFFAFYLLNTLFLLLTTAILGLITHSKVFVASQTEKVLMVSFAILMMTLTQFVIVPYDMSSYFFIALFFWMFLKYLQQRTLLLLLALGLIMLISTLNRESSALCISLVAAVLLQKYGFKKESIFPIVTLTGIFILTYLGLRLTGNTFTTNDGNLFLQNFTQPKNLLGIVFWVTLGALPFIISKSKENTQVILLIYVLALPYIAMCFYTGILYEVRLFVPLLLISLNLSKIQLK